MIVTWQWVTVGCELGKDFHILVLFILLCLLYVIIHFCVLGRRVVGGERLRERDGHIQDSEEVRALGIQTKMTYLSPSICYAGCDIYATPHK